VIDAVNVWEKLGCEVRIMDEGEYWPGRDVTRLRTQLDVYNRLIAGLGGALKDAADENGGSIESPIFAHPHFERLEAEGQGAHSEHIRQATGVISSTTPSNPS